MNITPAREPLAAIRSLAGSLHTIRKTCSSLSRRAQVGDEAALDRHAQIKSKLTGDLKRIEKEIGQVEHLADDLHAASQILLDPDIEPARDMDGPAATLAHDARRAHSPSISRVADRLALAAQSGRDEAQAARKRLIEAAPALAETQKLLDLQTTIASAGFDMDHPRVCEAKAAYKAALNARKALRKSA